MQRKISYLFLFFASVLALFAISNLGPLERTLGSNVRSVYLHGAWVWTALMGFFSAAVIGLIGLLRRRDRFHEWSIALGRTGYFFWLTYLPLSLWTMQMNWNGLFLEEPRWRISIDFAIIGLLIQLAILVMQRPILGSLLNVGFAIALAGALLQTEQIMHPGSPIADSDSSTIQIFFIILVALCMLAGWFLTKWFHTYNPSPQ